jgi:hypothetical protein
MGKNDRDMPDNRNNSTTTSTVLLSPPSMFALCIHHRTFYTAHFQEF